MPVLTVLHLIPTLEGGGAERQLSLLATAQASRGVNVHVVVRRAGVHSHYLRDGGVKLHELGDWPSFNPKLFFAILEAVRQVRPHIVQTWLPQMDILGGIAAIASRSLWIISERTSGDYYEEVPMVARLRLLLGRYASAIVANSDSGERYWRASIGDSSRRAVVRNAIDFDRIQQAAPPAAATFRRPLLLSVGRMTPVKAFDVIVRATATLAESNPANILLLGDGPERPKIEADIAAASVQGRMTLMPYQPDWWKWLKVADGLISMSRYEGNPNVVLEAMAGGCPVILSDIPSHREIADSSSAIFVPVDDVKSLAAAIANLVAGRQAARHRAERASARIGNLTIKAMADAYDSVYADVLKGKN